MKLIQKFAIYILSAATLGISGCGLFHGGKKCDCPKFGSIQMQSDTLSAETAPPLPETAP